MITDRALLDISIVVARPENAVVDGCAPGVGPPVAQMLPFVVDILLLVGHKPKEGLAVTPAKDE